MMMYPKLMDEQTFKQLLAQDDISVAEHPKLPLYIVNYTPECQFSKKWNKHTLKCRSIVVDANLAIVGRNYDKFFNFSELSTSKQRNVIKKEDFSVYEKMDGSFIQIFVWNGRLIITSRGSFASEHVEWAKEILQEKYLNDLLYMWNEYPDLTYCFELIHPDNRIVVHYGEERDLYLHGIVRSSGEEFDPYKIKLLYDLQFPVVKRHDFKTIDESLQYIEDYNGHSDVEGLVVRLLDGERFKLKFEDYKIKHRIMTNLSNKYLVQYLSQDWAEEFFDNPELLCKKMLSYKEVPDEFFDELIGKVKMFISYYRQIKMLVKGVADTIQEKIPVRKDQAMWLKKNYPQFLSMVFATIDNKEELSTILWKNIRKVTKDNDSQAQNPFKISQEEFGENFSS